MRPDGGDPFEDVASWVTRAGLAGKSEPDLLSGFCARLQSAGMPLATGNLLVDTLHPIYEGRVFRWRRDGGAAVSMSEYGRTSDSGDNSEASWQRSPFYRLYTGSEDWLRCRIGPEHPVTFSIVEDLKAQGMTDYVAMINRFAASRVIGEMDCVYSSWTTDRPGGFCDEQISLLRQLVPPLALAVKCASLARIAETIVETYLGADAGRRVLAGRIARGVTETISAALWFSDLRGFTRITDEAPPRAIIPFLNDYAEAIISSIQEAGGEVLKLIGDGTLAIFNADEPGRACSCALQAEALVRERIGELNRRREAEELPTTHPYIGLHMGEVFYGNIGSRDRLDFTVVGPAVNEASRIAGFCRSAERDVLVSDAFRLGASEEDRTRLVSVGRYALRGVERPQELFTLDRTS